MKELVVVTHCDGGDEKHPAAETVPFAWRGQAFELDACQLHAVEFNERIAPLIAVARKVKRGKRTAKPTTVVNSEPAQDNKALRDKVREHARKNGIEHANTGMLKQAAVDLWLVSHPGDAAALGVT